MSQYSLTLKPAQIEIILKPGITFTQAYEITNSSSETLLLSTSIESWLPADPSGSVIYSDPNSSPLQFSLSNSDLKLGQDFRLDPGQKKQLVLKINNPSNNEKDYYHTFFITQKPLNNILGHQQNLAKIGSHILISSSSQLNSTTNLEANKFSLSPKFVDIFSSVKISGEIFNLGPHFNQINGQISITKNHQNYWQQKLFPYNIASQSSRYLHCLSNENTASFCQLQPPLWPGHYEGTLSLSNTNSQYEYSFEFFVFPYSIVSFILLTFFLIFFILRKKQNISSN